MTRALVIVGALCHSLAGIVIAHADGFAWWLLVVALMVVGYAFLDAWKARP